MDGDEEGWRGNGSSFQAVVKETERGWGQWQPASKLAFC